MRGLETGYVDNDEEKIWREVETITENTVDFVVLNRAPVTLVYSVFAEGVPLSIKDESLYHYLYARAGTEAEDFRGFVKDFWTIKQRSRSLSEADSERLMRIIDFLETELADFSHFENITKKRYLQDNDFRRNVERFIENMVNASIDIAKILLASEKKRIPPNIQGIAGKSYLLRRLSRRKCGSLVTKRITAEHPGSRISGPSV